MNLTPLECCEALIAPVSELGTLVGLGEKAAYNWRPGSQYRDPGDLPPRVNRRLLAHAAKLGIPLSEKHLIWGAPYSEIAALAEEIGRPMPAHLVARGGQVAAE